LRHDALRRVLRALDDVHSVLEIGAGQGAFGVRLASTYEYTGLEPDPMAFAVALERFARLGRGTVLNGSVDMLAPASSFDLVCAFEVLEHIADPVAALEEWRGLVAEGRWLLLTVPAGHRLGPVDRRVGHYRRYEPEQLEQQLAAAGLAVVLVERFGFPLGHVLKLVRNMVAASRPVTSSEEERTSASGRWFQPSDRLAWATRAATAPFRKIETAVSRGRFGTSLIALARKPVEHSPP
jgi:SAM-dependent methyltransferase